MTQLRKPTLLLLLWLITNYLQAQKQANIWHFGTGQALDFSSGEPVFIAGSEMFSFEGSSSYCDSLGNLLFYTNGGGREPDFSGQDGGHIWNRNNAIIHDMLGTQGGGFSAAQSSVIVEAPNQPSKYYVFTMDEGEFNVGASPATNTAQPNGRGLSYFTVDMTLNGGLGGVVDIDQRIFTPSFEGLCAIRHSNQQDFWMLINQDTLGIGVYRLSAAGVSFVNTYTAIGPNFGIIKASPNGAFVRAGSNLISFNNTTGQLSNPISLPSTADAFEFSPNSNFLYEVTNDNNVFTVSRYNLQASNIAFSNELVGTINTNLSGLGQMQLGPDGKIYFLEISFTDQSVKLNRISCPNTTTPFVEQNVFESLNTDTYFGLPNFPAWIFENNDNISVNLGPENLVLCELDFPYTLNAQNPGATYLWSTGQTTQTIQITQPGNYSVQVTDLCGIGTDTIIISPCSITSECNLFDLGDTLTVCGNDTLQLQADLSSFSNVTGLSWSGGSGTFIPSDTVAAPRYVPTAAERTQGFVNLSLLVNATNTVAGQEGKLIAYDHLGADLIFYISPLDGSIDTIQDNAGDDWIATGFESSTSTLYGFSVFQGLGSIDIQTAAETPITFGYQENIFAGEFDNTNGIFYAVGVLPSPLGDPVNQQLYSVNTSTGALNIIGDINLQTISSFYYGIVDGINGLAYDPQGNILYGISYSGNLYSISVSDATTTLMGPTQNDCRGLAYDASTQKLWAISSNATLYEIDKNTGNILSTVPCQEEFGFITSLTYAPPAIEIQEFTCTDSLHVVLSSDNFLNLGNDTLLCNTPEFTLSQPGLSNYLWQDGSEDAVFSADSTGLYTLQASNAAGCVDRDSISIQFVNVSTTVTATSNGSLLCDTVQLKAFGGNTYSWSPSNGLSCDTCFNPLAFPSETTTYIVTGLDTNGCFDAAEVIVNASGPCGDIVIPNTFSPNGDNINDLFVIENLEGFKNVSLKIFNRWGRLLYQSDDYQNTWDGGNATDGTYFYVLFVPTASIKDYKGTITILSN